jgi:hypothetical protein
LDASDRFGATLSFARAANKRVDFRQKSSSSRRAAALLQGTSNAGGANEAPDSLSASLQNKALLYVTSRGSRRKACGNQCNLVQ